jgi:hypothetical protein
MRSLLDDSLWTLGDGAAGANTTVVEDGTVAVEGAVGVLVDTSSSPVETDELAGMGCRTKPTARPEVGKGELHQVWFVKSGLNGLPIHLLSASRDQRVGLWRFILQDLPAVMWQSETDSVCKFSLVRYLVYDQIGFLER